MVRVRLISSAWVGDKEDLLVMVLVLAEIRLFGAQVSCYSFWRGDKMLSRPAMVWTPLDVEYALELGQL